MGAIAADVDESKANYPDEPETQMKVNQQNALSNKVQDVLNASS